MTFKHAPLFLAVAATVVSVSQSAKAQDRDLGEVLEEVVVTGTRAPGRSRDGCEARQLPDQ